MLQTPCILHAASILQILQLSSAAGTADTSGHPYRRKAMGSAVDDWLTPYVRTYGAGLHTPPAPLLVLTTHTAVFCSAASRNVLNLSPALPSCSHVQNNRLRAACWCSG